MEGVVSTGKNSIFDEKIEKVFRTQHVPGAYNETIDFH